MLSREVPGAAVLVLGALLAATVPARGGEGGDPPNPFGPRETERPDAVPGKLVRSSGEVVRGKIFLTRDKRLELHCDAEKKWYKLKLQDLTSLEWVVEFEKEEKEWRWKESGSDVKVLTGRTKVDRRYKTVATRKDGTKVEGHIRGTVVYVQPAGGGDRRKFFVYWNHPSDFDQKPKDLVYVKEIRFGEEHAREPAGEKPEAPGGQP
ncbi:MAG: hypothetical protein ACYTGB_17505 [Planctomycetota bacterium]|jgi:hypothetical protein